MTDLTPEQLDELENRIAERGKGEAMCFYAGERTLPALIAMARRALKADKMVPQYGDIIVALHDQLTNKNRQITDLQTRNTELVEKVRLLSK